MKTEVFLEIQAGLTKGFDLNVTNTVVDDNSGRGIWVSKGRLFTLNVGLHFY
jgi:hypothetical protein